MNPTMQDIVAQAIASLGFDVFDVRQRGTRSRPLLEVRIKRQDGMPVSVDDCASASRAIEAELDGGKALGDFYTLEVSSPGITDDVELTWRR